jgi:DNA-binding response OmpR family regulator
VLTGHVLVVEDNPSVARALATIIGSAGFAAVPCTRGAEALNYCHSGAPVAAVIDIHLPDINGLVLAQKLREQFGPDTPIIVVSGDTSMETIKSLSRVGATYFLAKPLNASLLLSRLRELTGADGANRAAV